MKLETAAWLALGLVIAVGLALAALFFVPIPAENRDALNLVLGALLGWVGAAVTFYFGSTSSSKAKDATIASLTDRQP